MNEPVFHYDPPDHQHLKIQVGNRVGYMTFSDDDPESLEMKAWKLKKAKPELKIYVFDSSCPRSHKNSCYRELLCAWIE